MTLPQGVRLVKNIMSLVDQQAQDYIANLQDLRRSLRGQASTTAAVVVCRVFDKLEDVGKSIWSFFIPLVLQLRESFAQRVSNFLKRWNSQDKPSATSKSDVWMGLARRSLIRLRDGPSTLIPPRGKNRLARRLSCLHGFCGCVESQARGNPGSLVRLRRACKRWNVLVRFIAATIGTGRR